MHLALLCVASALLIVGAAAGSAQMEVVKIAVKQCKTKHSASDDDVAALKVMEPAKTPKTNCIFQCFLDKFQMLKKSPQSLDLAKLITISKSTGIAQEDVDRMETALEPCASITDDDECVFGQKLRDCIIEQSIANDLKSELFV